LVDRGIRLQIIYANRARCARDTASAQRRDARRAETALRAVAAAVTATTTTTTTIIIIIYYNYFYYYYTCVEIAASFDNNIIYLYAGTNIYYCISCVCVCVYHLPVCYNQRACMRRAQVSPRRHSIITISKVRHARTHARTHRRRAGLCTKYIHNTAAETCTVHINHNILYYIIRIMMMIRKCDILQTDGRHRTCSIGTRRRGDVCYRHRP